MAGYRLYRKAENDLDNLYEYGILAFGVEQADRYYDTLLERLERIADSPDQYPFVDYIRPGYRRSICGVHSIFYHEEADGVAIVRILGRQNLSKAFD